MQVLFDNGVPRGVASVLKEHVVEEARDRAAVVAATPGSYTEVEMPFDPNLGGG